MSTVWTVHRELASCSRTTPIPIPIHIVETPHLVLEPKNILHAPHHAHSVSFAIYRDFKQSPIPIQRRFKPPPALHQRSRCAKTITICAYRHTSRTYNTPRCNVLTPTFYLSNEGGRLKSLSISNSALPTCDGSSSNSPTTGTSSSGSSSKPVAIIVIFNSFSIRRS